jgi:DNA-binding LacI/PurR family transcriptional regulator
MRLRRPAATIMHTLEHQPISARRPHRSGRSRMIGVFSLDPTTYGRTSALLGIHRATRDSDHFVSVVSVPVPDQASVPTAVERLRSLAVEGILVVAPQSEVIDTLAELSGDVPVVVVAAGPQERLSAVAIDHYSGAVAATRHLLELGHRTVFHIAGPADREDPGARLAGWRDT